MTKLRVPFLGIAGPTAVGKTELSLQLAEVLGGEIISADSMQVYRHMDIGTAKLPREERRGILHYMIDVVEPTATYTVYEYATTARQCIRDVFSRGKVPIVVGGTGLYFRSLINEFDFTETVRDESLRTELEEVARVVGSVSLHARLAALDAEAAARIHPHDKKRLIRALEIVMQTGRSMRESYALRERQFVPFLVGLTDERERLYRRIDARVDHMIQMGLLREVEGLIALGCNERHSSMQAIGYKELVDYVEGRLGFNEAVELIKRSSRRYAKRQLSWFRAESRIKWYRLEENGMMNMAQLAESIGSLWEANVV